jgi:hypothetical protein
VCSFREKADLREQSSRDTPTGSTEIGRPSAARLAHLATGPADENRGPTPSAKRESLKFGPETRSALVMANSGAPETNARARTPRLADYLSYPVGRALETAPAGWQGSGARALLCPLSLLTGNSTGKFSESSPSPHRRHEITMHRRCVSLNSLRQTNRELFSRNSHFSGQDRECLSSVCPPPADASKSLSFRSCRILPGQAAAEWPLRQSSGSGRWTAHSRQIIVRVSMPKVREEACRGCLPAPRYAGCGSPTVGNHRWS